jgi:hypothetical protein
MEVQPFNTIDEYYPRTSPDFGIKTPISGTLAFSRWYHVPSRIIQDKRTIGIYLLIDFIPDP